jgi:hypothetical protein
MTDADNAMNVSVGRIGTCPVHGLAKNLGARQAKIRHASVTRTPSVARPSRETIQNNVRRAATLRATAVA